MNLKEQKDEDVCIFIVGHLIYTRTYVFLL